MLRIKGIISRINMFVMSEQENNKYVGKECGKLLKIPRVFLYTYIYII